MASISSCFMKWRFLTFLFLKFSLLQKYYDGFAKEKQSFLKNSTRILVKMLDFWRMNSTKYTKILHYENFVLTNMNIVCYSLCMDFGLRQNARRTEKKMWHSRLKEQ